MVDLRVVLPVLSFSSWAASTCSTPPCFLPAVGALVDTDSDTQQFMLPVTHRCSIFHYVSGSPQADRDLAVFLSIFPLTSPIVFPVRAAFSFDVFHLLLSMGVLCIVSIVIVAWIAGRIYRTGILMYGKRITWRGV